MTKFFPDLDPENNKEHRCKCGSKKVKPILFTKDPKDNWRIYCKPCYEKDIWELDIEEDWFEFND
jgi:hypothetical protein